MTATIEKVIKIILDKDEINDILNQFKNTKRIQINEYTISRSNTTKLLTQKGAICNCCNKEVMMAIIHITPTNVPLITFFCSSDIMGGQFTTDHILPRRLGGTDNINNRQILCYDCNLYKTQTYQPNTFINKNFLIYESYIKVLFRIYGSEIIQNPNSISSDKVVKVKKVLYNILKKDNKIIPNFDVETFNESFAYVVKYAHIIFD